MTGRVMNRTAIIALIFTTAVILYLLNTHSTGYFSSTTEIETGTRSSTTDMLRSFLTGNINNDTTVTSLNNILHDVHNETLGFQEIYVINLPERSDKKDSMSVQATLTNLSLTFTEGVLGTTVPEKARPFGFEHRLPAEVGCWRSHMNIMQHMVRRRVRSALIFEDDADWDVAIKFQMSQVAQGSRWLLNNTEETSSHSPYGDGWDVLWIGHCAIKDDPTDKRRWVIPKDLTVPPPGQRSLTVQHEPNMTTWESGPDADTQTRILFTPSFGYCSAAWAISLAGAEKIIHRQSMSPFTEAVDNGVSSMCSSRSSELRCIAPFPAIVGVSRAAGSTDRDTDIQTNKKNNPTTRKTSKSVRVTFSTRQNIQRLIAGETTFQSLYPNITGDLRSLEDIGSAVGHGELLE